jgi:hypothetical protein
VIVADRELVKGKKPISKKPRSKKFYFLIGAFLLLSIATGSGASVVGYQTYKAYKADYRGYTTLAQTGVQHLRTAETLLKGLSKNPLDARIVVQAQHEFAAASTAFVQLDNSLKSLPSISQSIPGYGARLRAALHLLPLAIEISQVGVVACNTLNLLISRFHDPLNTQAKGLTMANFTIIENTFQQIKTSLNHIIDQVHHLQPADLQADPRFSNLSATFKKDIPALQTWLALVEKLLPLAPTLLGIGTPANYLVEILDSTELRPGGGFIGNYGIVTLSGGRLTSAHITDTYLLDKAFTAADHSIPYPPAYTWFDLAPASWSLRDSNLDADFPTAARYAEQDYRLEGGNVPVQGVIAITPLLIQHALAITGPLTIPEYHETVTAQNLVDRIHYYQLGPGREGSDTPSPDGRSSVRKHFTSLLAEHFLARVHQLPSSALPKFFRLMLSSLSSKDLQIYLNPSVAEDLLRHYHLDSAIQSAVDDSLFVVDANISPSKANQFITNTMDDQVTIDEKGNATHHLTLSYSWVTNGEIYGSSVYRDYVRVYVPPSSILQVQNGWQPFGTSKAFGRQVWAGFFTLSYGQTQAITLTWMVPGVAKKDAKGWHYQYVLQRQAGAQWSLHLRITLPSCAVLKNKWGGLASNSNQRATLGQSLNKDLEVGVDYLC